MERCRGPRAVRRGRHRPDQHRHHLRQVGRPAPDRPSPDLPRHRAVDYSAPVGSNEGIILSRKPEPVSPIFNVVTVLTPLTWLLYLASLVAALLVAAALEVPWAGLEGRQTADIFTLVFLLYGEVLGENVRLNDSLAKSRKFFYFTFSVFNLFVIGFFIKVYYS